MPIKPVNIDAINRTFEKNSTDVMNAIFFCNQLYKLKFANENGEDRYPEYEDEQISALGLGNEIGYNVVESAAFEANKVHVTRDNPYESFTNVIYGTMKAYHREALEQDAMYKQILSSLPEDEPDREDKAKYLFGASGIRDMSTSTALSDFEMKAVGRLQGFFEDIVKKNPDKNWKEFTVGEVLDEFGMDEAQKQAFLDNHKDTYKSLDNTFYHVVTQQKPDLINRRDEDIISEMRLMLTTDLTTDIKKDVQAVLREELPAEEINTADAYRKQVASINEAQDNEKISDWVKEKGFQLATDLSRVHLAASAQKDRLLLESGKPLSDFNADASTEDYLAQQRAETSYVGQIIKGEKTASEVLDEFVKKGEKELSGIESKTAREFIDEVKAEIRENPDGIENDEDRPAKQFATIFAARILSDSKRGSKASLGETISRTELEAMRDKLMDNQDFQNFINDTYLETDDDGNYIKGKNAEHKLCTARTHGGFIEDEFKKYLLKKAPGELENSPELARFMPTAKERIEELKQQVKNAQKNEDEIDKNELQAKAAAEIIAIRNACKVERKTGYGLDKQIPPAEEGKRLENAVDDMTKDENLHYILTNDDTRRDLLSRNSHGGQMMINVRKQYDEQVPQAQRNPQISSAIRKNTVGSRMQELRDEAKEIGNKLDSKNPAVRYQAMKKSKQILGEYMALTQKASQPQGKESDAPWKNVDQNVQSTLKNSVARKMMGTREKASGMMKAISSGSMEVFRNKLTEEMNAVNAPKQKQAAVKTQQKVQEVHKQEGPGLG
ncbi:MAG: hypothetical protein J5589_06995 [Firmicutes bacterium]|nr:hypothetical protein [Bacillota bacterium]